MNTIPTDQGPQTPESIIDRLSSLAWHRHDLRRNAAQYTEHPGGKLCPEQSCSGPLRRTDAPEPRTAHDHGDHYRIGWVCMACEVGWRFGDVDAPIDPYQEHVDIELAGGGR